MTLVDVCLVYVEELGDEFQVIPIGKSPSASQVRTTLWPAIPLWLNFLIRKCAGTGKGRERDLMLGIVTLKLSTVMWSFSTLNLPNVVGKKNTIQTTPLRSRLIAHRI